MHLKKFEFLEHTADVGIRVFGKDIGELFLNAALGMICVMADLSTIEPRHIERIEVKAQDTEGLMFEWLNEIIYMIEAKNLIFSQFSITSITERSISAEIGGETPDTIRHKLKTGIKACTYHALRVEKTSSKWIAQVFFDV